MWLSGQQKRPADNGEGQTGTVTMNGSELAVMLESERRGLEIYTPAGYRWTPKVGQRVLVIKGQGEIPCVIGVKKDDDVPDQVGIVAKVLNVSGDSGVRITTRGSATVRGLEIDLDGVVVVNGERLENLIERIVIEVLKGMGIR